MPNQTKKNLPHKVYKNQNLIETQANQERSTR